MEHVINVGKIVRRIGVINQSMVRTVAQWEYLPWQQEVPGSIPCHANTFPVFVKCAHVDVCANLVDFSWLRCWRNGLLLNAAPAHPFSVSDRGLTACSVYSCLISSVVTASSFASEESYASAYLLLVQLKVPVIKSELWLMFRYRWNPSS